MTNDSADGPRLLTVSALPPSGRPRHAAYTVSDTQYMPRIDDDDELLDKIGRGDYTSVDPLGAYLGAYRDRELASDHQYDDELTIALVVIAALVGLLGIALILLGGHVIGVVLLAIAVEHAGIVAVLNRRAGGAR